MGWLLFFFDLGATPQIGESRGTFHINRSATASFKRG